MKRWFGSFVLVLLCLARAATAQEIVATPWTGAAGIAEPTAETQMLESPAPQSIERQALPRRPIPNADRRIDNTASPALPGAPAPAEAAAPAIGGVAPALAQTASATNFAALDFTVSGGFVPPDTHGDVGPTQYIAAINLRVKSFNKATGTADGVLDVALQTFFASVSGCAGACLSDPRVIYDRIAQRWVIVIINVAFGPTGGNRVLIATSDSATITAGTVWTKYFFQQDLVTPAGNTNLLCDYPNAGLDANAIYIGCDMFDNNFYYGSTVFVVRKSSVYSGGPIVVSTFRNLIAGGPTNPTGAGPNTPKGVTNFDPAATVGYFIGEDNASFGVLQLLKITSPGTTPVLAATTPLTVASFRNPIPVPAKGSTSSIDGNDNRVMNAEIINGSIWLAHGSSVDNTGSGSGSATRDRNAVRWYQITTPATTPTVAQTGTVFDSTTGVKSYTYGSINVNGQGHAAIGFTVAGPNDFPGVAFDGRLAGDAVNSTQGVQTAFAGTEAYQSFDSGTKRWGDFSNTSVDPSDNMSFWTVQEYAGPLVPTKSTNWYTRVVKLLSKPPATPVTVVPPTAAPGQASVNLVVTGTSAGGSGFYDPGPSFPNRIAAAIPGVIVNSITYTDPTHLTVNVSTVGATAGAKNVTITNPDGQAATGTGIFTVTGVAASPPVLQSAVLRRVHGAAGTFDLPLTLTTPPTINHNPTTEPRSGTTHQIVLTYDKPLSTATVNVTEGTAVKNSSLVGSTVVVNLTGVTNAQYVTVSLTSVGSTDGGTGGIGEARVGFLEGDVNQSRVVTVADLGLVNAQLAQPVTAANFLKDVNATGTLTVADKGITNSRLTNSLPTP
jgi:hypothetical protein